MKNNAIIFTANTIHVAQANLLIDSLFDPNRGNFKGDLWVISTHLDKRCQRYLTSRGVKFLINPLTVWDKWAYRDEIARAQPNFRDKSVSLEEAFRIYKNKRMSKLIIIDWVQKFGQNYDKIALCDNDIYIQKDINELFDSLPSKLDQIYYWHEENFINPGSYLWEKNFHFARLHDLSAVDFGGHEINIGFIISSPDLIRDVFHRVSNLFVELKVELFSQRYWHDQDLVRVVRGQSPELFKLFSEGDVLHLCNGGEAIANEIAPTEFVHRKTGTKPFVIHFAGGAWQSYQSISSTYTVHDGKYFFMEEQSLRYDRVRQLSKCDLFDRLTPRYSQHNAESRNNSRKAWIDRRSVSEKPSILLFSWLNTGSHKPVIDELQQFLSNDIFDMAIIDGNINHIDYNDIVVEDLPDALSRVTHSIRDASFSRSFGYKRDDIPDRVLSGAIASLVKEYRCSERSARALANVAYDYLNDALRFYNPSTVVCWAAYTFTTRIIREICEERDIPFFTMEFGLLPGTLIIDSVGHMGASWVARDPEHFNALPISENEITESRAWLENSSKAVVHKGSRNRKIEVSDVDAITLKKLKRDIRKKIVIVGSNCAASGHVPYGQEAKKYHSPFFIDNNDLVSSVSKSFQKRQDKYVIIYKPHPIVRARGLDIDQFYENVFTLVDVNLDDCIEIADLIVTNVSQSAYESLLQDVPVLMVGRNQITGSSAVFELQDKNNLEFDIMDAIERGYCPSKKRAFLEHISRLKKYYLYSNGKDKIGQSQELIASRLKMALDKGVRGLGDNENRHLKASLVKKRTPRKTTGQNYLSVIMPVFNGERYLASCIGSILNQTMSDLELICINNGSNDRSGEIIRHFAAFDERVKYIEVDKADQNLARNLGLDQSSGELIHFVDCDDIVPVNAYERFSNLSKGIKFDLSYLFFAELHNDVRFGNPRYLDFLKYIPKNSFFKVERDFLGFFLQYPFTWGKIFRRKFLLEKAIRFDVSCANYEDNPQNLDSLLVATDVYAVNDELYNLRIRSDSLSQSVGERAMGMLTAVELMNEKLIEAGQYTELEKYFVPYKIHLLCFAWERVPSALKRQYWEKLPSLFLPGDDRYFDRDDVFSMFQYLTPEKVDLMNRAISGDRPPLFGHHDKVNVPFRGSRAIDFSLSNLSSAMSGVLKKVARISSVGR